MNLAMIMIPKVCTAFLRETQTVRQGWEIMKQHGYTAIPVLGENDEYTGTVNEGDFLRFIMNEESTNVRNMEKHRVAELVRKDFCPPLEIDASIDQVIDSVLRQNFVPIVDSRGVLSGILTRQGVIRYLADTVGINKKT